MTFYAIAGNLSCQRLVSKVSLLTYLGLFNLCKLIDVVETQEVEGNKSNVCLNKLYGISSADSFQFSKSVIY